MKLMYPPTKTNILNLKRTDLLFYKQPSTETYKVFNQTKGIIGEFTVEKRNEMFINNLFVTSSNRRNNLGTQILNFIKILNYSLRTPSAALSSAIFLSFCYSSYKLSILSAFRILSDAAPLLILFRHDQFCSGGNRPFHTDFRIIKF